ncbi:MAG: DnaJ domain-containing protein [Cellvibrionales bacterium]|nr:DnaJ domain-containing protein [Cellvibrionales bacterium]
MEFKDYYQILGVDETADDKTIKTAYRRLARKYHPDINKEKDAEDKFKEVAEAYDVLKDKEKRAEYDQLRQYGRSGQFEPPPDWQGGAHFYRSAGDYSHSGGNEDFSDFFESIFGGRGGFHQEPRQHKGQDIETELGVFLEDLVKGQPKAIQFSYPAINAQGHRENISKTLEVKIPKGIQDGERIRLRGQGAPGVNGGESGDLYLTIKFVPHPVFDIEKNQLMLTVPLLPHEAALGAKVIVPTLTDKVQLSIPPNTQAGSKLRLKAKGLPTKTGQGDLLAVIRVVMPSIMTEQDKALWQKLADSIHENPRSEWG